MFEKRDYPEFDGKEVIYEGSIGKPVRAIVVGLNYYVGITLISKEDKTDYLYCGKGPLIKLDNEKPGRQARWDAVFPVLLEMVAAGVFSFARVVEAVNDREVFDGGVSAAFCPFNQ